MNNRKTDSTKSVEVVTRQEDINDLGIEEEIEGQPQQFTVEMLDGLPWEIALSTNAANSIEMFPPAIKKAAIRKLVYLAQGNRSSRSAKRLEGVDWPLVLYESYLPDGTNGPICHVT